MFITNDRWLSRQELVLHQPTQPVVHQPVNELVLQVEKPSKQVDFNRDLGKLQHFTGPKSSVWDDFLDQNSKKTGLGPLTIANLRLFVSGLTLFYGESYRIIDNKKVHGLFDPTNIRLFVHPFLGSRLMEKKTQPILAIKWCGSCAS